MNITDKLNTLILGSNEAVLREQFPDDCIDLTVTSPPYDNIRNYNGKLSEDEDFNGYSFPFDLLAEQLYRVTKPGGVVVWVVGDQINEDGSETGNSFRQALRFKEVGFNIHDTMIYEKTGVAFPSNNRYYQAFEYMFVFSKGRPKTTNMIADRKNIYAGSGKWGRNTSRGKDDELIVNKKHDKKIPEYGVRYNIWRIKNSMGFSTEDAKAHEVHPAIFPEALARDHVLSWSNEGDVVLDPFMGSGTTAKMALNNRRSYVGIDLNQKYIDYATKRLGNYGYSSTDELCEF